MDQQIINLYDSYTHSQIDRKNFMKKLAILTGSTAMALTILPMLESNYAAAATVNDEDVQSEMITFPGVDGDIQGLLAMPKGNQKKLGTVVVIHENRGLTPHIKDVTKRVALAGFIDVEEQCIIGINSTIIDNLKIIAKTNY